jgi:RHS repeat-associated protein
VRTWDPAGSFEFHKYVVGFTYDLAGRRTVLQVPSVLVAPFAGTTIGYSYDANTGALSTVTALDGQQFRYHDDLAGRLDSLIAPTANGGQSLTTAFSHSDDGDLLQRIQMSGAAPFHRDSLLYDARGKIVKSYTMIDSTFTVYSGLGNLLYAKHRSPTGYQNWEETFTVDALGNQHQKIGTGFQGKNPMNNNTTYTYASGRLTNSSDSQGGGSAGQNIFDAGGNRTMSYSQTGSYLEEIKSYYAHDGMLRKVDRRVCGSTTTCSSSARGAYEDYRYDALGRRVLVRSQRNWCTSGGDCRSSIMRVVWDGDQILGEIRMPGYSTTSADTLEADTLSFTPPPGPSCPPLPPPEGCNPADTLPSAAPYYGHVTYTHGLGIDQPLEVLRGGFRSSVQDQFAIVPLADWRGLYDNGVFPQSGPVIKWPASSTEILKYDLDADDDRGNWMGGLIYQNRDMGGSQYMRNRYYDAATGRFTQEDPIGLAGGINLYGFGNGDPVNYSDPFGLDCRLPTTTRPCDWDPVRAWNGVKGTAMLVMRILDKVIGGSCEGHTASGQRIVCGYAMPPIVSGPVSEGMLLERALASEGALAAAQEGRGVSIAGAGAASGRQIDDIDRLLAQYGGQAEDWAKMSTSVRRAGRADISVHWYENVRTGQRVEFKTPWDF